MVFIFYPTGTLCNIGPGADIGQPFRDGFDIAARFVNARDRRLKPVLRDSGLGKALAGQKFENPGQQGEMLGFRGRSEIRHPADIPQQAHAGRAGQFGLHLGQLRQVFQRQEVIRFARPGQPGVRGRLLQRPDQAVNRAKFQPCIAPVQFAHRFECVVFDGGDFVLIKRPRLGSHAKGAVFDMPPGPPGDLRQFLRVEPAHPAAVKFRRGGKGHVFDVQVQPHADGIGRHQIINLAILIQSHLRIARARRKRPHDHGASALGAADQFGDGIDIFNRKPDNRAAFRHPAYLFRT